MGTKYDNNPLAPKRCPECGGIMVWGQMRWGVSGAFGGETFQHADGPEVERADMRGQWYPATVNICTLCGHIGFYVVYPQRK